MDNELTQEQIERMVKPIPGDFVVYLLTGRQMKVLYFSNTILSSFGVTAEEFCYAVRKDALDVVMPADREMVLSTVCGKPVGPELIQCQFRLLHRTKGFFWVHSRSRVIGTMGGCSVILTNYLNASAEAESYCRILDDTATALFTVDIQTREILYANQAAVNLSRADNRNTYAGYTCHAYFYGQAEPCAECPAARLVPGQKDSLERFDKVTGRWIAVEFKRVDWLGHDCMEISANDITELKLREAALKREAEEFHQAVDRMLSMNPNAICIFRLNLTQNSCSEGHGASAYTRRLLHSDTADGLFKNIISVIPDAEQRKTAAAVFDREGLIDAFRCGKTGLSAEYLRKDENGQPFWVRTYINMLKDPQTQDVIGVFHSLDISAEKALQQELEKQRRNQMEQTLLDTIGRLPANYVLYREDGIGVLIPEKYSDEFCQMKGCTQQNIREFNGAEDGFAPVHPDDRAALAKSICASRDDKQLHNAEYRIRVKSGGYKWVSVNYSFFSFGDARYLYAVYTDIDRLKKEERQLQEQYDNALAFLNSASGTYLATQRVNLTKNTVEAIGGRDPLSMKSRMSDYDTFVKDLTEHLPRSQDRRNCAEVLSREYLIQAFERGEKNRSVVYMLRLQNRSSIWVQKNITLAKRPGSDDIIAFAAVSDINEEKLTGEIMEQIVAKQFDYVSCISAETGRFVLFFSNIRKPELNGIRPGMRYDKMLVDYNTRHVLPGEAEKSIAFMSLDHVQKELEKADRLTGVYTCDEGSGPRVVQVEFFWLDRENGLIVLVRSDITETQRQQLSHEQQLRAALYAAETANRAKSDFLSRMSHDIRTPLNGIIGMTYLTKTEKDPERIRGNLEKIDTSSKFLLGLINDVLDMSKAESGKIELHPEPYTRQELESYMEAVIRPLVTEKNQRINYEISLPEDAVPIEDKLRTNQIIFNILSNAVKFTPEGGRIRYTESGKTLPDGRMQMHLEIADNGIGMSEEFMKNIFDPFSQEGRNDSSLRRGTGLGMAITKRLVDLMGGTIRVESKSGQGTTFFVDWVTETAPASTGAKPASLFGNSGVRDDDALAGKHILLCEDHPLNQEIARTLLERKKLIVAIAEDGRCGMEMFRDSSPGFYDVILMDIRMPVMDGYEATRRIRAMERADAKIVPIIAMTADAFAEDVRKCMDAGMNGHIAKPIHPEQLYQTIRAEILKEGQTDF